MEPILTRDLVTLSHCFFIAVVRQSWNPEWGEPEEAPQVELILGPFLYPALASTSNSAISFS